MGLLSYTELCEIVEQGAITCVTPELVNGSSIDITLGENVLVEQCRVGSTPQEVSLREREQLRMTHWRLDREAGCILHPGEFVLAQSAQLFNLPMDISCEYKLKSSMARMGLQHLNAGWCDPGWNGSVLTMELVNCTRYHEIRIRPGDRIGQMVFFRHAAVPRDRSYAVRGSYNKDAVVTATRARKNYL